MYVYLLEQCKELTASMVQMLRGYEVVTAASPRMLFHKHPPQRPGCLILDLDHPCEIECPLPTIGLITAPAMHIAVAAMREKHAIDVLRKPVSEELLCERVDEAIEKDQINWRRQQRLSEAQRRLSGLTSREKEVLWMLIHGRTTPQIARELFRSKRTVDAHRCRLRGKLQLNHSERIPDWAFRTGIAELLLESRIA